MLLATTPGVDSISKLEARVKTAYDKEYSRIQIAMAKQVAREDALRDTKKGKGRK